MDSPEVAELKRFFGGLEDGLHREIRRLAELVSGRDSKIGREFGALRKEMHKEFAETKALLRSHLGELDSRVRRLEAKKK